MPERSPDRSYALSSSRPASGEVRRAARGRAEHAIEQLREEATTDPVGAVHEARKDMKKLRSLLRLVRGGIEDGHYRAENERFRDAARLLSDARDADVLLETVAALRERYPGEAPAADGLVAELEAARGTAGGLSLAMAAEAIESGAQATDCWQLSGDGWELYGPGLLRAYRRGRKGLATVERGGDAEAVHEWRKRVKDLWYQLRLVRDAWPGVTTAMAEEAHQLSGLLGDHHDLSVLAEHIRDGAAHDGAPVLLELAERRQGELLAEALPLGRRLYAERPKRFARRMAAYWDAAPAAAAASP